MHRASNINVARQLSWGGGGGGGGEGGELATTVGK